MKNALISQLLLALLALWSATATARALRGVETTLASAAATTPTEPRNMVKDVLLTFEYLESFGESVADLVAGAFGSEYCLYGDNCGLNCEHNTYNEDDALDTACYVHDDCLRKAESTEDKCACDDRLIKTAGEIADWELEGDDRTDMILTAATVRDGIKVLGKELHGCN